MLLTASGTLGSRVLGLVRDRMIAGFFGTGPVSAALLFALSIPNLFRRLLGEGALTSALIPVMTAEKRKGGKAQAFRFLNQVLTRAALLMAGITLAMMLAAWILSWHDGLEERLRLSARLTILCMPYMPLICLTALFTAGLNILGRFGITALSAVWLNIAMIALLAGAGYFVTQDETELAVWVCCGSLLGGLLQLCIPATMLWRTGWRPRFSLEKTDAWEQLRRIFVPAIAGAGILQINFFVSRFLALNVDDQALTLYYIANRVVEFPIGVFAIAVSTVVFPSMSRHAEHDDRDALGADFSHGMRLIFAINIPAATGLIILAAPIVRLLFENRKFTEMDTLATVPLLWIFAAAMPINGMLLMIGRGFNALKDTRTQARLALWMFLLNLALSPLLAWHWGAVGLAIANSVCAVFQCVTLWCVLRKKEVIFARESLLKPLLQCTGASAVMGGAAWGLWQLCTPWIRGEDVSLGVQAIALFATIAVAALLYFTLLGWMHYPEHRFLLKMLRRPRQ
ncbi:MAG: murein biosynthesis integral membrane protein MurJ [Puniceicoccales bacterium]|nr:murein biosynthesis integral membrane protein MurJ [Puniceicoccales bacterium]